MNRESLHVVLDEDLANLLQSIGQLERLEKGSEYCSQCGLPMNLKNLQVIVPLADGTFVFVCSDINCVERYFEERRHS
jgi:hypothetical protein